jgi:hypothetical protein
MYAHPVTGADVMNDIYGCRTSIEILALTSWPKSFRIAPTDLVEGDECEIKTYPGFLTDSRGTRPTKLALITLHVRPDSEAEFNLSLIKPEPEILMPQGPSTKVDLVSMELSQQTTPTVVLSSGAMIGHELYPDYHRFYFFFSQVLKDQ